MRDRGRMVLLMEGTVIDVAFFLASEKERRARVVVCLLTAAVRTTILREPTKRSYLLVQENKRAVRGCCSPTVSPLSVSLSVSLSLNHSHKRSTYLPFSRYYAKSSSPHLSHPVGLPVSHYKRESCS